MKYCAVVVLLLLAACASSSPPAPMPAPMAETIPKPPVSPTPLIWQTGHWDWTGNAYVWVPGQYVTVDYSDPGQAIIFDASGKTIWRWNPSSGLGRLAHPSLAIGLPNGDIMLNDDYNHRVIVIDPKTNTIVWQYGHTGQPGSGTGYLNHPDGLDPLPPFSLADTVGLTAPPTPGRW